MEKIKKILRTLREKFIWFKYRNQPYIKFYREVMRYRTQENPKTAIGGPWEETGRMQLVRLKRYGLKPEHTLLDIGCGALRGGRHIIPYLNRGNYTGNDISPDILEVAKKTLRDENLNEKKPTLFLSEDVLLKPLLGKTFDFIHARSVLTHMPPDDMETLFISVKKIMHKQSVFLATFFLSKNDDIYPGNNMKNFSYPLNWIVSTCAKHGLIAEMVESDKKQKMLKITLA